MCVNVLGLIWKTECIFDALGSNFHNSKINKYHWYVNIQGLIWMMECNWNASRVISVIKRIMWPIIYRLIQMMLYFSGTISQVTLIVLLVSVFFLCFEILKGFSLSIIWYDVLFIAHFLCVFSWGWWIWRGVVSCSFCHLSLVSGACLYRGFRCQFFVLYYNFQIAPVLLNLHV